MNIIRLSKVLEVPHDNETKVYVSNLEALVNDLSVTSFNNNVELYPRSCLTSYNIFYGTIIEKDRSGVPMDKRVLAFEVDIKTIKQFKQHVKKALRTDNPNFLIECTYSGFCGAYYRVELIVINETNSSTRIGSGLNYDRGLAEISFRYDPRSSNREKNRIDSGISRLIARGYNKDKEITV